MKAHEPDAAAIRRALTQASAEFRRLNPAIFGGGAVAGRLPAAKPERDGRREAQDSGVEGGAAGMEYRVTLTTFRRRTLDNHDNARAAMKPVVDLVTAFLGFKTDDHPRLYWEYHQVKTSGRVGTLVLVERKINAETACKNVPSSL